MRRRRRLFSHRGRHRMLDRLTDGRWLLREGLDRCEYDDEEHGHSSHRPLLTFVAPVDMRERDMEIGGYFSTILAAGIFALRIADCGEPPWYKQGAARFPSSG